MSLFDSISARARGSSAFGALGVSGRATIGKNGVTGGLSANIGGIGRFGIDSGGNLSGNVNIGGVSLGLSQGGACIGGSVGGVGVGINSNGGFSARGSVGGLGIGLSGGGGGGCGGGDCVSPVWGGISLSEAKALHQKSLETRLAFKNLWMLEVVSSPLGGDFTETFNLFAHSVEFTPITLAGDKVPIGAAVMDTITSAQPIELSVTTRDDEQGRLRRWFDAHAAAVANSDGTIGYPADYAISIKITHAFITPDSNRGGFEDKGRYRPGSINVSLSRDEQNVELLTMTFIQLDTFMAWQ